MKTSINLTATDMDLDRFADRETLRHFYKDKGVDGLELMLCYNKEVPEKIPQQDINGVHLRYFTSWYDFWQGNTEKLKEEYGEEDVWKMFYGGTTREDLLAGFREELEIAHRVGAKYVVFHVAECALEECLTYRFRHSDEEICRAACEVINELMDNTPYDFYFLVENLWWSGLNLKNPEVTRAMMDGIHYRKKGIMLDTGHLIHTNHSLKTQEECVDYIHSVLDRHGDLCRYIKGIHLNQSISGAYVESVIANPPELKGPYWDRLSSLYPHIFKIDFHEPFTAPGVAGLIRRIHPEFVTYELITRNQQEHEERLTAQLQALAENGGIE